MCNHLGGPTDFWYQNDMRSSRTDTKSQKRPGQSGTPVMLRLQPDLLAKVDKLAEKEGVSRPEAVRKMIERS